MQSIQTKCKPKQSKVFSLVSFNVLNTCLLLINVIFSISNSEKSLQIGSKNVAVKEMQTFAILDFPLPGSPGFPLNALYGKPENKNEEGKKRMMVVYKIL